jgi:Tol biopolymer transport system component
VRRQPAPVGVALLGAAAVEPASDHAALSPAAWAPDGRRFAYGTRDGVWIHGARGTADRRVVSGRAVTAVAWSAAADWLAYVDRGTLHTVRPDGRDARRVAVPGVAGRPVWAPGGDRLVFTVRQTSPPATRLWITSPDGATLRPILWDTGGRQVVALSWYPDAVHLFVALAARDGEAIAEWWRVRIAYPDFRRLPGLPPRAIDAAMAPNAEWIALVTDEPGGEQLVIQRADGSGARRLAGPGRPIAGPAWGPHSDKIAYGVAGADALVEIYAAAAVGTAQVRVAAHPHDPGDPSPGRSLVWSPDGSGLAFGTNTGATLGRVWVARFSPR